MEGSKYLMKKVILAAGVTILGSLLVFLYKVGEDMTKMTRCGCHY